MTRMRAASVGRTDEYQAVATPCWGEPERAPNTHVNGTFIHVIYVGWYDCQANPMRNIADIARTIVFEHSHTLEYTCSHSLHMCKDLHHVPVTHVANTI